MIGRELDLKSKINEMTNYLIAENDPIESRLKKSNRIKILFNCPVLQVGGNKKNHNMGFSPKCFWAKAHIIIIYNPALKGGANK